MSIVSIKYALFHEKLNFHEKSGPFNNDVWTPKNSAQVEKSKEIMNTKLKTTKEKKIREEVNKLNGQKNYKK